MPLTLVDDGSAPKPLQPVTEPAERRGGGVTGRLRAAYRRTRPLIRAEWLLACAAGIGLSVAMFWPVVRHPATKIPADIGDPTLQAWQMAWAGHILKQDPAGLWHANAFYPERYSYVFSDTLLGYAPAGLIGSGPVAALVRYNCVFVFAFALAFIGSYALVRQVGGGRLAAAVAAVGFAYAPWHWNQCGHLHVLSSGGIVLSLAMLARGHGFTLRRDRPAGPPRPGWALAGWVVAAWQITLGFGIGIPFGYLLGGLVVAGTVWAVRRRPALPRRLIRADAAGGVLFGLVTALMVYPYLRMIAEHPYARRGIDELEFASPQPVGLFTAPGRSVLWGQMLVDVRTAMSAPTEQTLFPGLTLCALAVVGLFVSAWSRRARLWLLGGTVLTGYLALGLNVPFGQHVGYVLLFRYAPGWDAIRTPGRLTLWTTLLLAVLAAGAITELARRVGPALRGAPAVSGTPAPRGTPALPRPRSGAAPGGTTPGGTASLPRPLAALAAVALVLPLLTVTVEGLHRLDFPVVPPAPAAMRTAPADPLLVLPTGFVPDENAMLWSTDTFPRIVNGGSGFTPRLQGRVREAMKAFPDGSTVRLLREVGVRTVIVLKHNPFDPDNRDYARAADPGVDIGGLGITRTDDGETIRYDLTPGQRGA